MENWKDIKGFEGAYQVSDLGNIRSLDRFIKYSNGKIVFAAGRAIKPYVCNTYLCVKLHRNEKMTFAQIHQEVAKAFIPNPDNKPQVNHEDGNKKNNAVSNLSWMTQPENIAHASRMGLLKRKKSPFPQAA
jgi:hypothetical protein